MRRALFLIGELTDPDLHWLLASGEIRTAASGTALIEESGLAEFLFIVLDGELEVRRGGRPVARLDAGEVAGEMSLLDGRRSSATVVAVGDVRVFAVPHTLLRDQLRRDESFSARFHRAVCIVLADRLGHADELIESLAHPGKRVTAPPATEIPEAALGHASLAAARFDWFLKSLSDG